MDKSKSSRWSSVASLAAQALEELPVGVTVTREPRGWMVEWQDEHDLFDEHDVVTRDSDPTSQWLVLAVATTATDAITQAAQVWRRALQRHPLLARAAEGKHQPDEDDPEPA